MPCCSGVETSHDFVGHDVSGAAWPSDVPANAWHPAKHTSPATSAAMVILRRMLAHLRSTFAAPRSGCVVSLLYYPEPDGQSKPPFVDRVRRRSNAIAPGDRRHSGFEC